MAKFDYLFRWLAVLIIYPGHSSWKQFDFEPVPYEILFCVEISDKLFIGSVDNEEETKAILEWSLGIT